MSFKDELEIFRNEANSAAQFFYASLAINALAGEHPRVLKRLNIAPLFWKTIKGSLEKSAIVAIGRIFDNSSPHNVARLLKSAENLAVFSKQELAQRKQEAFANDPQGLANYLAQAHEPSAQDLRQLKKNVAAWRAIYEERYKPLRDRFYAHRELPNDAEELHDLIAVTRIEEVERMCIFLIALHEALWQTYENGRQLVVEEPATHSVLAISRRITSATLLQRSW